MAVTSGQIGGLVSPDVSRPGPPAWLREAVFAADRYRCVYCGATENLQLDHVWPRAHGGLDTSWNLAALDKVCNRTKSDYYRDRDGYVYYRPFPGFDNRGLAQAILRRELRARRNPLRWLRLRRALRAAGL